MEMVMKTYLRQFCIGGLALLLAQAHAAKDATDAKEKRAGVHSLDVCVEGARVHLLIGEYDGKADKPALFHLRSDDAGVTWASPIRVDAGSTAPHTLHRGMDAQIAVHGEQLIAAWTIPGTDQWGSGPIATARSSDGGKSWQSGPNPADDGNTAGHGFIDMATDSAGTWHLTWLDGRDGKQGLRYARSIDHGQSWSKNSTIKSETCECCPNTFAIMDKKVAILFRDKAPRDLRAAISEDAGATWTLSHSIGNFDWRFDGCPHVGGGISWFAKEKANTLHAVIWSGKADRVGVHHLASKDHGKSWSAPHRLGDSAASHPDLASGTQRVAAVWVTLVYGMPTIFGAVSSDSGQTWSPPERLSAQRGAATHPRVIAVGDEFRAFWTEARPDQPATWRTAELTGRVESPTAPATNR